jgi:hypothetical protein
MKGIVLFAYGKKGYILMAHNMAVSIKRFTPHIPVTLYIEEGYNVPDKTLFDNIIELDYNLIYTTGVGIDPAKVKVNIFDLLPYEHNLYLDVDGLILQDISGFIDTLANGNDSFVTDIIATGKKNDSIEYSIWASNEAIWKHFELKDNDTLPSTQTSWMYIRKDKNALEIFETAKQYLSFPKEKLRKKWGGTIPDEVIFSGTLAKLNKIPTYNPRPIFFGSKNDERPLYELEKQYYILSLYGNGRGRTMVMPKYIQWYNDLIRTYGNCYKSEKFMHDKHANG